MNQSVENEIARLCFCAGGALHSLLGDAATELAGWYGSAMLWLARKIVPALADIVAEAEATPFRTDSVNMSSRLLLIILGFLLVPRTCGGVNTNCKPNVRQTTAYALNALPKTPLFAIIFAQAREHVVCVVAGSAEAVCAMWCVSE